MHRLNLVTCAKVIATAVSFVAVMGSPLAFGIEIDYEQNANGQPYDYHFSDGSEIRGNFPNNHRWNQSLVTQLHDGTEVVVEPGNWSTNYYPGSDNDPSPASDDVYLGANLVDMSVPALINTLQIDSGGTLNLNGGAGLTINGPSLANNGSINVKGGIGGTSVLKFNGGILTGSGIVTLIDIGIGGQISGTFTQGTGHTIQGVGGIDAVFTNNGLVNANTPGGRLSLGTNATPSPVTNGGVLEATNGGRLSLLGVPITQSSSAQIGASGTGSIVTFDSSASTGGPTINGGTLVSSDGGAFQVINSGTIGSLTNNAQINILGGSGLKVIGDLVDNGTIAVSTSPGADSTLSFDGGLLSGTGTIVLNDDNSAHLTGSLTQGSTHLIQGHGKVTAALTNNGVVNANVAGGRISLNGTVTNYGLMRVSNGSLLQFNNVLTNLAGGILTDGSYEVDSGSTIDLPGSINTNAATITLGGPGYSFSALNSLSNNVGTFTLGSGAQFVRTGSLTNSGIINVNGGKLSVTTSLSLDPASTLNYALSGTAQDSQYGLIIAGSTLAIAGTLNVTLANGFRPKPNDLFDILDWGSRSGTFSTVNLENLGGRIVWDSSHLYDSGPLGGTLLIGATYYAGDFNRDGVVDAADIAPMEHALASAANYQTSAGLTNPGLFSLVTDVNGDGHFDNADLQALLNLLRSGNSSIGVPEPASVILLTLGIAVIIAAAIQRKFDLRFPNISHLGIWLKYTKVIAWRRCV